MVNWALVVTAEVSLLAGGKLVALQLDAEKGLGNATSNNATNAIPMRVTCNEHDRDGRLRSFP